MECNVVFVCIVGVLIGTGESMVFDMCYNDELRDSGFTVKEEDAERCSSWLNEIHVCSTEHKDAYIPFKFEGVPDLLAINETCEYLLGDEFADELRAVLPSDEEFIEEYVASAEYQVFLEKMSDIEHYKKNILPLKEAVAREYDNMYSDLLQWIEEAKKSLKTSLIDVINNPEAAIFTMDYSYTLTPAP